jgi:hypothetical protein
VINNHGTLIPIARLEASNILLMFSMEDELRTLRPAGEDAWLHWDNKRRLELNQVIDKDGGRIFIIVL